MTYGLWHCNTKLSIPKINRETCSNHIHIVRTCMCAFHFQNHFVSLSINCCKHKDRNDPHICLCIQNAKERTHWLRPVYYLDATTLDVNGWYPGRSVRCSLGHTRTCRMWCSAGRVDHSSYGTGSLESLTHTTQNTFQITSKARINSHY